MPETAVTSRPNYAIGAQGEMERGEDLVFSTYVLSPRQSTIHQVFLLKEKKSILFSLPIAYTFATSFLFFCIENPNISHVYFFSSQEEGREHNGIQVVCASVHVCALIYLPIYLKVKTREELYFSNAGYLVILTIIFQLKMSCTSALIFFPSPHPHSTQWRYHSLNLQPTPAI